MSTHTVSAPSVTLDHIREARERIKGVALRTPIVRMSGADGVYLKAENLQPVGSFKMRGAYNKIASLPEAELKRGVITYSSGNHAQAVAFAAKAVGTKAVVVMPDNSPKVKVDATKSWGAEVVFVGPASSERLAKAEELQAKHGYIMVPPYDDPLVVAGQGTCGLEIVEDMPDVKLVLSPISGGGLLSGVATAVKLARPDVKVIGVEPELAGDAQESFCKGQIIEWPAEKTTRTICDGLRTQSVGSIPFSQIRAYVDDIVTVTEDEIRSAMREIAFRGRMTAEPSGAASVAAALYHRDKLPAGPIVCVLSGGNVDPALFREILG